MRYTESDRRAFMDRQEPFLGADDRAALRSTLWTDSRIDMAISLGG